MKVGNFLKHLNKYLYNFFKYLLIASQIFLFVSYLRYLKQLDKKLSHFIEAYYLFY